jgi:hypothetical protein
VHTPDSECRHETAFDISGGINTELPSDGYDDHYSLPQPWVRHYIAANSDGAATTSIIKGVYARLVTRLDNLTHINRPLSFHEGRAGVA